MGARLRAAVVAVLAMAAVAPVQVMVDASRARHDLAAPRDTHGGRFRSPVEVVATVGLGGARALVVDYLWLRTMQMQDERRFYEIALLCQLILEMEPLFTQVWAFHAWNMAYNISCELPTKEAKWFWIREAVDTLQRGLVRNGRSYLLYRELGWLYYHRCSYKSNDPDAQYFMEEVAKANPGIVPDEGARGATFALAERCFRRACEKPDIGSTERHRLWALAIHCLEARGMLAEAEAEWKRLVAAAGDEEDTPKKAFLGFYKGVVFHYHVAGKLPEARAWYGRLVQSFGKEAPSYDEVVGQMERDAGVKSEGP